MIRRGSGFLYENYQIIFSVALAVLISATNVSFVPFAEKLADYENHRTETG